MTLGAGRRDQRIEFQRLSADTDDYGEEVPGAWVKIQSALAAVRYGASQERREAATTGSAQAATFRVLATSALREVTGKDRLWFRGQPWDLAGPAAEVGRTELEFTATRAG